MDTKITPDVYLLVDHEARQQPGRLLILRQEPPDENDYQQWVIEDPGTTPTHEVVTDLTFRAWVMFDRSQLLIWPSGPQPALRPALHAFATMKDTALRRLARPCWPKEQHATEGAAAAQLRSITKRDLAKDTGRIHVYKCPHCGRWHVGH